LLKHRVVTALALLAVLLPLLFQDNSSPFIGVGLLMLSAGAWEWARLNQLSGKIPIFVGGVFGLFLTLIWLSVGIHIAPHFWWVSAGLWGFFVPWLLLLGVGNWQKVPQWLRLCTGLFSLMLAWLAMAQARTIGINFLLSIFSLVWMADIAAYFGGKMFGRHKLAPNISPGKSWEGAIFGWIGVLGLAALWIWIDTVVPSNSLSFYSELHARYPLACWVIFSFLAAASVTGDLIESLVKRSAGFKDSSNLLPGHGGILDRIDALLPVLPLTILFLNF
jgi:phosphatidate cytidylyltransferase